jgi:hypothetical protein
MQLTLSIPAALYALVAIPILALLLLMMPRSRRITVGSLAFWAGDAGDAALSRAARRRLDLASVILLCALAVFILALSSPALSRAEPTGPAGVILFDRSPSVLMSDGDRQTRLSRLREAADTLLAGLPAELQIAVEMLPRRAGDQRLEGPAEEVRALLPKAITVSPVAMSPATLRREVAVAVGRESSPVALLTDISPYGDAGPAENVHVYATGGQAANMAITAATITYRDGTPHAMVETFSFAEAVRSVPLRFSGQGLSLSRRLTLAPGTATVTVLLPAGLPDRVAVQLDCVDALATDNATELVRTGGRRWRTGLVGRADPMLLRFFTLAAQTETIEYDDAATDASDLVDVTFFVDRMPSPRFRGPAVLVNPAESNGPLTRTSEASGPGQWTIIAPDDPLAAHLPKTPVAANRWTRWQAGDGATVIARSASGDPMIARYDTAAGPRVAVLFDIDRRNTGWSAQQSFALFWYNALLQLSPRAATVARYEVRDGTAMLAARVEGRQVRGAAFDERDAARRAFEAHEREVHPTVLPLWPPLAALAGLLILARVWIVR